MTTITVLLVCQAIFVIMAAFGVWRGMEIFLALMQLQQQGKRSGMTSQLIAMAMAYWFGAICLLYLSYRVAVITNLMRIG